MGTASLSPRVLQTGRETREVGHSRISSAEVKDGGAIHPLSDMFYGEILNYLNTLTNLHLPLIFTSSFNASLSKKTKKKLHGLSPRANYTDRATAACRRSDCQLLRIEGATWSA
jgi:hypothetical protein